jgi:hypothetical protein
LGNSTEETEFTVTSTFPDAAFVTLTSNDVDKVSSFKIVYRVKPKITVEKIEKIERIEKIDKTERIERNEKAKKMWIERIEKIGKIEKTGN